MSAPELTRRACPACGDSTRLYRDVEQVWNPATGEWEFAGTMGKADCSTCDWSGTEDETEGPLCQGCGKPEAACSANPCAAVAADRGDGSAMPKDWRDAFDTGYLIAVSNLIAIACDGEDLALGLLQEHGGLSSNDLVRLNLAEFDCDNLGPVFSKIGREG